MIAIRYYRQYLWIFFYLFFFLMAAALALDCYDALNKRGEDYVHLARFMNVLFCFSFGGLGIVLQHFSSRGLMGLRFIYDRKRWNRRKMRVKRRSYRKVAKRKVFFLFYLVNLLSIVLGWFPILLVWLLKCIGAWQMMGGGWFHREFFCSALLIKYVSWYLTLLTSRFSIFLNKKRLNGLA